MEQEFEVMFCWLANEAAKPRAKYTIVHTSKEERAIIKKVVYKIDTNTFGRDSEDSSLSINDIARVKIRTTRRMMLDAYRDNQNTGSVILIDKSTNETVGARMVV